MRRGAIVSAGLLGALVGCTNFPSRVEQASSGLCADVVVQHDELARDPRYKAELTPKEREKHEASVADCYLDLRRPERAVELTGTWDKENYAADLVRARAAAQLGREDDCRAALSSAVNKGLGDLRPLLLPEEFGPFAGKDWFVRLAARVWMDSQPVTAETFAEDIASRSGQRLLPLKLVSADASRPSGELAVWTGKVRDSRIDRANGRTLLLATGIDGAAPNGIEFVVRYAHVNERLVSVNTILAFGRYAGRDPDGNLPVLDAFIIQEHKPGERSERVR